MIIVIESLLRLISNLFLSVADLHSLPEIGRQPKTLGTLIFFFNHRAKLDFYYLKKLTFTLLANSGLVPSTFSQWFFLLNKENMCDPVTDSFNTQSHFFSFALDNLIQIFGLKAWAPQSLPGTYHMWIFLLFLLSCIMQTNSLTVHTLNWSKGKMWIW